jgi:lipoate-protein ligase A
MTKQDRQKMVKSIEETLATTQRLWEGKDVSHAHIIGYLESALKQIKRDIEKSEQLNK